MLIGELPISPHEDDDILATLVGRAKQGNGPAFSELVQRVRTRVRTWAVRITDDEDDADDVAQQVLVKLHVRIREFEGRSRFTTWLYRMTVNTALNRRRLERRRELLLRDADAREPVSVPDHETGLEAATLNESVLRCLDTLSAREREVFERADLKGESMAQIATSLGLQPVSVRSALSRARRRIRLVMLERHPHLLEEYGNEL